MSKTRDRLNIISKFSLNRFWNLFLLQSSYHYSKLFKRNSIKGFPFAISIEPTTACNLGCPECPSGLKKFERATGNLKRDLNKKIIDEVYRKTMYINFYFQGEPFIHPEFLEMVAYAKTKKIYTSTSTNGHFLDSSTAKKTVESGLDRLIISIDGTTQDTYEKYRIHGKLEKVIAGTKNILRSKKELSSSTPHVIFQFLVVKPNEHQIDDVLKLANELGVDEVRFKTAQVYEYKNGNELIPDNEKYSRYKKMKNGEYRIKNKMEDKCWRMWSSCVITWDGKIVPCCFDKDAKHQLGNLKTESFVSIWKSKPYHQFRQSILSSRKEIDICQNCSEGTKVWT